MVDVFFHNLSDRANMKSLKLELFFMKTTSNSLAKGDCGVAARIFDFQSIDFFSDILYLQ